MLAGLEQRLGALNPLAVLSRGFAVISQADGTTVRRVGQVHSGETLTVQVSDGKFAVLFSCPSDQQEKFVDALKKVGAERITPAEARYL